CHNREIIFFKVVIFIAFIFVSLTISSVETLESFSRSFSPIFSPANHYQSLPNPCDLQRFIIFINRSLSHSFTDLMNPEEANDSLDTLIRQAIGKEPYFSLSRPGDSQVQWLQLLNALEQPDLPGWPLLTPLKVQMQKCDKCSREFCSPINYRRHIRVHHRLKKLDKDSTKNRDLLSAFWDKLSEDETKQIVSFEDVSFEEAPGSSVVKALTELTRKTGYICLPHVCLRAGSALLEIMQCRPSRFPISSQELFSILDDASEKTFLCGPAVSMKKYIFDGDVGKTGLDTKNVVACSSFLLEQKLIKAWLANKDAEALRCHKLLVEEEEAARRRQDELLERKRQKKLRQKEQRAKEQRDEEKTDVQESISDTSGVVPPAETSTPLDASDSGVSSPDDHSPTYLEAFRLSNIDDDADLEMQTGSGIEYPDSGIGQNVKRQVVQGSSRRHTVVARWHVPQKSQRGVPNGFHNSQNPQTLKLGTVHKHVLNKDSGAAQTTNGTKIWSRKLKLENDEESFKIRMKKEAINQPNKNHEVLIGSISVTLQNSSQRDGSNWATTQDDFLAEHHILKKNNVQQEKRSKLDSVQHGANRSEIKLWRPVSQHGVKSPMQVQNGGREFEVDVTAEEGGDQILSCEGFLRSCASPLLEEQFNRHTAEAFLGTRWKEAIGADHVKLVLSPESEHLKCPEVQIECQEVLSQSADIQRRRILGNAENWVINAGTHEFSTAKVSKSYFRTKPERGGKIKYVAKRTVS
ncbi:hypothetical protein CFOL_v3_22776, partial [Cephalotus follicularis]